MAVNYDYTITPTTLLNFNVGTVNTVNNTVPECGSPGPCTDLGKENLTAEAGIQGFQTAGREKWIGLPDVISFGSSEHLGDLESNWMGHTVDLQIAKHQWQRQCKQGLGQAYSRGRLSVRPSVSDCIPWFLLLEWHLRFQRAVQWQCFRRLPARLYRHQLEELPDPNLWDEVRSVRRGFHQ